MKKLISLLLAALLVLSLAGCGSSKTETAAPASSGAGDYPANTITLYCGYSAGGGSDVICRILAEQLVFVSCILVEVFKLFFRYIDIYSADSIYRFDE